MKQRAFILGWAAVLAISCGCQGEQPVGPTSSTETRLPAADTAEDVAVDLAPAETDADIGTTTAPVDVARDPVAAASHEAGSEETEPAMPERVADRSAVAGHMEGSAEEPADHEPADDEPADHEPADHEPAAADAQDVTGDQALPAASGEAAAESVGDRADEFSAELFHRWPQPQVALVFSGALDGYFEPCGCAGLENQIGGLSRRHTFLEQLRERGWEVVPLDLGGLVKHFGRQSEIKYQSTMEALRTMGYAAVGFGPQDLRLPVDELEGDTVQESSGFVSANVDIVGDPPTTRLIEAGGRTIGVTAVMGEWHRGHVNNDDLTIRPAEEALAEVAAKLEGESDFQILLAYATPEEAAEFARRFPQFDLVVMPGGADEPAAQPSRVDDSGAWLVEVGHKGMFVNVMGLFDDEERPLRFQRVALDKRFADSPAMHQALVAYQGQLQSQGWKGLELKALKHPTGRQFAGSQSCAECHTKAYEIWSNTPHAHATQTLVDLDPPRQYDPECVSCHVTGWEPQKYVPFISGFDSLESTPLLTTNGCENCHGPGADHVKAELGEIDLPDAAIDELRAAMRLPLDQAEQTCLQCHDLDNSPDFEKLGFEHYWQEVEHHGKD